MMIALAWKDFREQRTIWTAMLVLNLVAAAGLPLMESLRGGQIGAADEFMLAGFLMTAMIASGIYGLVCGAMLLAGEREAGTMAFLDGLAGRRASVWWAKLLTGLALTLILGLVGGVAAAVCVPSTLNLWTAERWLWALPAIAVDAFLWGLLGSALCRSVMAAVMSGATCLTVTWIFTGPMISDSGTAGVGIGLRVAFGFAALTISAWVFCRRDLSRGPTSAATPAARFVLVRGSWRAMLWLIYRQVRWEVLVLGIVAGVLSVFVPADYLGVWALASLFLGVIAGTGVFSAEQRGGYQRFLADQRLPLGRIWWFKTLSGCIALLFFGFLLTAGSLIVNARHAWERSAVGPFGHQGDSLMMLIRISGLGLLMVAWPAIGFGIGQFCGLVFRKGVVAVVFALIAAAVMVLVWTPSLLAGGLTWWQMLGVPLILLAGTRLVAWDWATERLQAPRPALVLVGCVVLAALWSGGVFAYRATDLPDVGEPFDVAAYKLSLRKYDGSKAGDYIASACRRVQQALVEADKAIGPPQQPVFPDKPGVPGIVFSNAPLGNIYLSYAHQVAGGREHPKDSDEFNRWLDRMFADEWVGDLKAGLAERAGLMLDPRRSIDGSLPDTPAVFAGLNTIHVIMPVRVRQLLARAERAAALDQIIGMLALARLAARNPGVLRLLGQNLESSAFAALEEWLVKASERPELVRRALKALQDHEREMPSREETLKAEYLIARNRLDHPIEAFLDSAGAHSVAERHPEIRARMHVFGLSHQVPWERERARRMLNAVYGGWFQALGMSYSEVAGATTRRIRLSAWGPEYPGWVIPGGTRVHWDSLQSAVLESWHWVFSTSLPTQTGASECRLAAAKLQLALVLYQLEEGRAAASLQELVPKHLPSVPLDPFTGREFQYRVSTGETIRWQPPPAEDDNANRLIPVGHGILWSGGADGSGIDDGGTVRGNDRWIPPGHLMLPRFDWIFIVPQV